MKSKQPACVYENKLLADLTTFKIGGPVRWLALPGDQAEIIQAVAFANAEGVPVLPLGGGSNILAGDGMIDAMALRLRPHSDFAAIRQDRDNPAKWLVGAAAPLQAFVHAAASAGAAGPELFAGIPGTVGGAVRMNAGGADFGIGELVHSVRAVSLADGMALELTLDQLVFRYRQSNLHGWLVVDITFMLDKREEPAALLRAVRERRESKAAHQPLDVPSAGCIFRNPPGDAAGRLIDAAGCKGLREGMAEVSGKHANFIVNLGGARCRDVLRLADAMREKVLAKFGIELEREIQLWQ